MISMAVIHFVYTDEKRVVSLVRAAQRKPVERQPKHPVHAGRDGERPQDECSFSFYNNRKSPKRTDRTVFPHPARTVRRAAARHRNSANKLCTDDRSEQLIALHHKPSPDDRRIKEQNDITLRGRPRWVTVGAVQHRMPNRNNTNQPRSNSFRRFYTAETCQYVYYCLRSARATSSENLLL